MIDYKRLITIIFLAFLVALALASAWGSILFNPREFMIPFAMAMLACGLSALLGAIITEKD